MMRSILFLSTLLTTLGPASHAGERVCETPLSRDARHALAQKIAERLTQDMNIPPGSIRLRIELTRRSPPLSRPGPGVLVRVKYRNDVDRVTTIVAEEARGSEFTVETLWDHTLGPGSNY